MRRIFALLALLAVPSACCADDITALYPDGANVAVGIDIKGIMNSPLGKKVIGNDKPFDAARKLLKVLFPVDGALPVEGDAGKAVAVVANKLERVTIVGRIGKEGQLAIYLEGDIDEEEYAKAAKAIADHESKSLETAKLGKRKLLQLGTHYGVRVNKSLFVITSERDLVDDILAKHSENKNAAKVDKLLAERLKDVKPADTPIWLAAGEFESTGGFLDFSPLSGLVGMISLKDSADIRFELKRETEDEAMKAKNTLEMLKILIAASDREDVWKAAAFKVKRDGKTATATASIPAKLLIEKYAEQK